MGLHGGEPYPTDLRGVPGGRPTGTDPLSSLLSQLLGGISVVPSLDPNFAGEGGQIDPSLSPESIIQRTIGSGQGDTIPGVLDTPVPPVVSRGINGPPAGPRGISPPPVQREILPELPREEDPFSTSEGTPTPPSIVQTQGTPSTPVTPVPGAVTGQDGGQSSLLTSLISRYLAETQGRNEPLRPSLRDRL